MIQNADNQEPLEIHKPKAGPKLVENKKQGNNALCACGSGKKYKKCCKVIHDADRAMRAELIIKLLYCFVAGLEGQDVLITKRSVDAMPANWPERLQIKVTKTGGQPAYLVSIKPEPGEEKLIKTPGTTLVGPNGRPL